MNRPFFSMSVGMPSFRVSLLLIPLFLMSGCASGPRVLERSYPADHVVPLRQLGEIQDVTVLNDMAVYLEQGETFPLEIAVDTGLFTVAQKKVDVVVKRRVYVSIRFDENMSPERQAELRGMSREKMETMTEAERARLLGEVMLFLSPDARHWAPLTDMDAIKQVFGIQGGSLSLGLGMTLKDGLWGYVTMKTQ